MNFQPVVFITDVRSAHGGDNASYSKKVPAEQDYSSKAFMACVEVEPGPPERFSDR